VYAPTMVAAARHVAEKVMAATKERRRPSGIPQSMCPDVHPLEY